MWLSHFLGLWTWVMLLKPSKLKISLLTKKDNNTSLMGLLWGLNEATCVWLMANLSPRICLPELWSFSWHEAFCLLSRPPWELAVGVWQVLVNEWRLLDCLRREKYISLLAEPVWGVPFDSLACNLSAKTDNFYLNIHLQIQSDLKEHPVILGMATYIFLNLK